MVFSVAGGVRIVQPALDPGTLSCLDSPQRYQAIFTRSLAQNFQYSYKRFFELQTVSTNIFF
jgi:hypothetical protein